MSIDNILPQNYFIKMNLRKIVKKKPKNSDLIHEYAKIEGEFMTFSSIEYPALVYKNPKNNVFVANCIVKKLIGYGHTEKDAVNNLESVLKQSNMDYPVKVKPVYRYLPNLA